MMKFGRHCKKQFQQSHGKCPFTAYFKHEGLALNERNITAWQASLMHLYLFFSICTLFIYLYFSSTNFYNTQIHCERGWWGLGQPNSFPATKRDRIHHLLQVHPLSCPACWTIPGFVLAVAPTEPFAEPARLPAGTGNQLLPLLLYSSPSFQNSHSYIIKRGNIPRCIWVVDNLVTMDHHKQSPPIHEDRALSPMTVNSKP